MKNRSSIFIYPILLVISLDAIFTILGQPKEYWQNYLYAHEGSPLGFNLLHSSPWIFLAFMALYSGAAYLLLKKLPLFWSLVLGLSLFSGHLYGSGSWISTFYLKLGLSDSLFVHWYLRVGYYILISLITALIINNEIKRSLE